MHKNNTRHFLIQSILLIITILFFNIELKAEKNPWYASKDDMAGTKVYYELFGGIIYPAITFSNSNYDNAVRTTFVLPEFGISARFQFKKWISLAPRLSYSQQGIGFQDGSIYKLTTNNINFSLPVDLQFQIGKSNIVGATRFFLFAGPYIGAPFTGKVSTGDYSYSLNFNDLSFPDYGFEAGFGFRIPTFSLENRSFLNIKLSYSRGFANTYSASEPLLNPPLNERLYLDGGQRFNGGLKLIIGIEMPKKSKRIISFTAGGDGKKNYKKAVIVDER